MDERYLTEADAMAALGLVGQLAENVSCTFADRKRRLLEGLAELVHADAWAWILVSYPEPVGPPAYLALIDGGWQSESQKLGWLDSAFSLELEELVRPVEGQLRGHCTFTRSDLVDDEQWYASSYYRRYRMPFGLDDLMFSFYPADSPIQSTLRLHRFRSRSPFVSRDRNLVHVVTGALDWLHRAAVPEEPPMPIPRLSRRERQVLLSLLSGDSTKQIAYRLDLSRHTVIGYTKELYSRFGVHSRGELLARFISSEARAGLGFAPLTSDRVEA